MKSRSHSVRTNVHIREVASTVEADICHSTPRTDGDLTRAFPSTPMATNGWAGWRTFFKAFPSMLAALHGVPELSRLSTRVRSVRLGARSNQ